VICRNVRNNRAFVLREMQLGMKEPFSYFQCGQCQCFQIAQVPADLARFYPRDYYSFADDLEHTGSLKLRSFFLGAKLLAPLIRFLLLNPTFLGRVARRFLGWLDLRFLILEIMSQTGIHKNSRILDVGSGAGFIAYCLQQIGFRHIMGIDPFVTKDLRYRNGLEIRQTDIFEFARTTQDRFDLITFHHSLEHMEKQVLVLKTAASLLRENGLLLVRMPVVDCYAFELYQENLVSLDAPRHLVIHSRQSAQILAEQAGLTVDKVLYDSNESQFWASAQFQRDIPLESAQSYRHNARRSIFSRQEMRRFRQMARELNACGRGDWAAFFLRKQPALSSSLGFPPVNGLGQAGGQIETRPPA
jgi:SAM-dependent methyltransferase